MPGSAIARNWQAIAVYDQAADFYERYAKEEPHRKTCVGGAACPADRALSDAVALRLGLGQEAQAVADVARYQSDYGAANATDAAQIALAMGIHDADKADWQGARKALAGAMRAIDRAPLDVQLQGHATYARAMTHLQPAQARAEYARVRAIWGDGASAAASLDAAYRGASPDELAHRLGRSLDAVGEAMFFAAEADKHDRVDSLPIPPYRGSRTKDDIRRFMDATMMPWAMKKQAAIESVDREYQRITELRPVPPPRWVIAAASRGGMMWGDFVDDFRKAPYPREWDQPGFVPGTAETLRWTDSAGHVRRERGPRVRAVQARQGQARARALPGRLGELPVLRRAVARVRALAGSQLQVRVPRGRRAEGRAHAVERRARRSSAAAHDRGEALAADAVRVTAKTALQLVYVSVHGRRSVG